MIEFCLTVALAASPVLIDGVAAVVGSEVITVSEIDGEARIVLLTKGGPKALSGAVDDAFRATILEYVIVQELLAEEARRNHHVVVREAAVDTAVRELQSQLETVGGLERLLAVARINEDELRTIMRRDLAAKRLVDKVLGQPARPPPSEVARFLKSRPELLPGRPLPERQRAAERELVKAQAELRFRRYVEGLKKDVEIRRIAAFVEDR